MNLKKIFLKNRIIHKYSIQIGRPRSRADLNRSIKIDLHESQKNFSKNSHTIPYVLNSNRTAEITCYRISATATPTAISDCILIYSVLFVCLYFMLHKEKKLLLVRLFLHL